MLSIVIPTLNEAANIGPMVAALRNALAGSAFEIIIVDDNSGDGTGRVADELAAATPGLLQVIHRTCKASLGTAALAGWQAARGDVLALMDADFQHPPEVLPRIFAAVRDGADIAIASRYAAGGHTSERWSLWRKLISQMATFLTRLLLGRALRGVHDPFSGCFALRRAVIAGRPLHPEGFKVLMEVLAVGSYREVREVPYQFAARAAGESKMRLSSAISDLRALLRLAWQTRTRRQPPSV
jgi:dolichol-phosphate mannosyltransferase